MDIKRGTPSVMLFIPTKRIKQKKNKSELNQLTFSEELPPHGYKMRKCG